MALTPIQTGNINNLPALEKVKYTQLDYDSIKQGMVDYITSNYPTVQNDFFESNAGIMILDILAWINDTLALRADFLANEAYLPTAATNRAIRLLLSYIGYFPAGSAPAIGTVQITLQDADPALFVGGATNQDIAISTKLNRYQVNVVDNAGNSLSYEVFKSPSDLDSSVIFPAGSVVGDSIIATIIEGKTVNNSVQLPTSVSPNFLITLGDNNIIGGDIGVKVNGVTWRTTQNFAYENGPTNTYEVVRTDADIYQIEFGDGVFGAIPPANGLVEITYRVGGGDIGNISLGVMNTIQTISVNGALPATFQFYNNTATTGGENDEDLEFSRKIAPKNFAAQLRTVTGEDYTVYAVGYKDGTNGAISKALSTIRPYLAAYSRNAGPYDITNANNQIKVRVDDLNRTIILNNGTGITVEQLVDDFNIKARALFATPDQVDFAAFTYPTSIYKIVGSKNTATINISAINNKMSIMYGLSSYPVTLTMGPTQTIADIRDDINNQVDITKFRAVVNSGGYLELISVLPFVPGISVFQIGASVDNAYLDLGFSTGQAAVAYDGFKFAVGLNYHTPNAALEVLDIANSIYSTIGIDYSTSGNGLGRALPMAANYVDIYVLAQGPNNVLTQASSALKEALVNFINRFKVLTDQITVVDGLLKEVGMVISLYVDPAYNVTTVKNQVSSYLSIYTSGFLNNFGDGFYISKIYELMEAVPGVDHAYITDITENGVSQLTTGDGQMRDISCRWNEVWVRDVITINALYANAAGAV
jgi:hypothetical protein